MINNNPDPHHHHITSVDTVFAFCNAFEVILDTSLSYTIRVEYKLLHRLSYTRHEFLRS